MSRSLLIDSIKVLASQLIVLHHLVSYSPMAEPLAAAWPLLVGWIEQDGRLAVQPFLVMGGFLAARSMARVSGLQVAALLAQRYLRLAPQLLLALLGVMAATHMFSHQLGGADWLSPLPSWREFLAHLLFLQDVLGIPAISAGVWYVAIDFQLYGMLVLCAWGCGRSGRELADSAAPALVALGTCLSILIFSRNPDLDIWGPYFLSAYGLGVLAAWAQRSSKAQRWGSLVLAVLALDWLMDPRERPLWALATALGLYSSGLPQQTATPWRDGRVLQWLSDLSYSVFVGHFAVIILISGLWMRWSASGTAAALAAVIASLALSVALGALIEAVARPLIQTGARWKMRAR